MKEIWKDIKGYEGLYQVSNLGGVKSISTGLGRSSGPRVPWPSKTNYLYVSLSNGGKKNFLLHRLVAIAFIPNPDNKPCINHKNGIKSDCKTINLEWCTHSENMK